MNRKSVARILALALLAAGLDTASGQEGYPAKTIRIVTTAAGSGSDYGARLFDPDQPGLATRAAAAVRLFLDGPGGPASPA